MRIYVLCNLMPRTDLDKISSKNFLENKLVKPAYKFTKSIIKTSSKIHEPKTYDDAINDFIYGNRWRKALDKELWNLNSHQIFYTPLPDNQKTIGYK